jgi:hypothetical protein
MYHSGSEGTTNRCDLRANADRVYDDDRICMVPLRFLGELGRKPLAMRTSV